VKKRAFVNDGEQRSQSRMKHSPKIQLPAALAAGFLLLFAAIVLPASDVPGKGEVKLDPSPGSVKSRELVVHTGTGGQLLALSEVLATKTGISNLRRPS
jgi:hypothetical protein